MDDDDQQQWFAEVGERQYYEHMQRVRSDTQRILDKWEAERPQRIALQQQLADEKANRERSHFERNEVKHGTGSK